MAQPAAILEAQMAADPAFLLRLDAETGRIEALPLEQLEALAEALLDFSRPAALTALLAAHI